MPFSSLLSYNESENHEDVSARLKEPVDCCRKDLSDSCLYMVVYLHKGHSDSEDLIFYELVVNKEKRFEAPTEIV